MKRLIIVAALGLGLAACNNTSEEADTADEAAAPVEEAAPTLTAANGSPPGMYEVTAADGTVTRSELRADGTYTDFAADGGEDVTGTWSVVDGKTCFDPDGDDPATCYTETAPGADGSFTATPDEGEAVTVKPVTA